MLDLASFKPGQTITLTLNKLPRREDAVHTVERLMRLDPVNRKALKRAQRMREQRILIYNRGNRDWVSREKPALVVRPVEGATWSMSFDFDIARDLQSVGEYLSVKSA
ncbi:MAG: hypothetical protein SFY69_07540 [Planctomycetota bacterium]|nr:hypothetical protein [Planctomycetota bacterium]